jgi:hypothetical protein
MQSMTISTPVSAGGGWLKFDLNVGGFKIRGCTWHPATDRLRFPRRHRWPRSKQWMAVVRAPQPFVKRLKRTAPSRTARNQAGPESVLLEVLGLRRVSDRWYTFGFHGARCRHPGLPVEPHVRLDPIPDYLLGWHGQQEASCSCQRAAWTTMYRCFDTTIEPRKIISSEMVNRFQLAMTHIAGKRLTYQELKAQGPIRYTSKRQGRGLRKAA